MKVTPDQDRPEMLQACDDLYNVLIDSPAVLASK